MARELSRILAESQSGDPARRLPAEKQLLQAEKSNLAEYLEGLSIELADENVSDTVRQLAGIVLKNSISGNDPSTDKQKREQWVYLDQDVAQRIRDSVLRCLASPCPGATAAAAQVITKIARLDVPSSRWPQVLPQLVSVVSDEKQSASYRRSACITLGYICEDLNTLGTELGSVLLTQPQINAVMTAIITACRDQTDPPLALSGYRGLYHALLFAEEILSSEAERNVILRTIADGLSKPDALVQQAAWECTLQLATEYYQYLDVCLQLWGEPSLQAIRAAHDALNNKNVSPDVAYKLEHVALAAVELWSTIADEELLLVETAENAGVLSGGPESTAGTAVSGGSNSAAGVCKGYIRQAHEHLIPTLLQAMIRSSDEDENVAAGDEWTLGMAAGTCLALCAQLLREQILVLALPFININFAEKDWSKREAAVLVYGSIMEGPPPDTLAPLVAQSLPLICGGLKDGSAAVRETTAWALGRTAGNLGSFLHPYVLGREEPNVYQMLLLQAKRDSPRVASFLCFAVHEIARSFETDDNAHLPDKLLEESVGSLLEVANRSDAGLANLRSAALEALSECVSAGGSSEHATKVKHQLIATLHSVLTKTLTAPPSDDIFQLQAQLCSTLSTAVDHSHLPPNVCTTLLNIFIQVIRNYKAAVGGSLVDGSISAAGADEDAALAVASLPKACGLGIIPSLEPDLLPILIDAFHNPRQVRYCRACTNIISEVACNVDLVEAKKLAPEGAKALFKFLMTASEGLLAMLGNVNTPHELRPPIVSSIADVIISIGDGFFPLLDQFLGLLAQAQVTRMKDGPQTEEWCDYIQNLRDAVGDGYMALLVGMKNHPRLKSLAPKLGVEFAQIVLEDEFSSQSNARKAVDLLSDLAAAYKSDFIGFMQLPIKQMLERKLATTSDEQLRKKIGFLGKLVLKLTPPS